MVVVGGWFVNIFSVIFWSKPGLWPSRTKMNGFKFVYLIPNQFYKQDYNRDTQELANVIWDW